MMDELTIIAQQILENLIELNYKLSSKKIKNNEVIDKKNYTRKRNKGGNIVQKGSITKRKDGRWMGRFYSIEKKQICIYAKNKRDCQIALKKAIELEEEKKKNNNKTIASMNFAEWWDYFFKKYRVPIVKESTVKQLDRFFLTNIKPFKEFSNKKVIEITSLDVEMLLEKTSECESIKRKVLEMLKSAFSKLYELGEIKKNPMAEIVIKKNFEIQEINTNINNKILSHDEENKILENVKSIDYKNFFIFALNTGMRISEILAITPNDIDFENKIIKINKQLNITTNSITTTKSLSGNRIIPLFDNVSKMLVDDAKINSLNSDECIFKFKYYHLSNEINRINSICNIKFSPHTLRKTFASRCQFDLGIPIKIVQTWLGHSNEFTTDKYYTFANNEMMHSYISKYNNTHIDTYTDTHIDT